MRQTVCLAWWIVSGGSRRGRLRRPRGTHLERTSTPEDTQVVLISMRNDQVGLVKCTVALCRGRSIVLAGEHDCILRSKQHEHHLEQRSGR